MNLERPHFDWELKNEPPQKNRTGSPNLVHVPVLTWRKTWLTPQNFFSPQDQKTFIQVLFQNNMTSDSTLEHQTWNMDHFQTDKMGRVTTVGNLIRGINVTPLKIDGHSQLSAIL